MLHDPSPEYLRRLEAIEARHEERRHPEHEHEPGKHQPPDKPHDPSQPQDPSRQPQRTPQQPQDPNQPSEEPGAVSTAPLAMVPGMNIDQFEKILTTLIAEARKPVKDERTEARIKRMRDHNRQMLKDQREMMVERFHNCNHMQLPGSVMTGCSCIAWAEQSDHRKRGTCQHCGTVFSAIREECVSAEIWEAYKYLVRLPTHPAGNINNIFMSA